MKVVAVIPARIASTRLPEKPLALIGDRPMIWHVLTRVQRAKAIDRVIVATDDRRIADCVKGFGGEAVLTDPNLASGTDRVAAAVKDIDCDIVLNVQGDEPFIDPHIVDMLASYMVQHKDVPMGTLITSFPKGEDINNPSQVKVTITKSGRALYFSRSVIPYNRTGINAAYYKHIGIYAFTKPFLQTFVKLDKSSLESTEMLEQLRAMENGYPIQTVLCDYPKGISIDTPEDLRKANEMWRSM